MKSDFDDLIKNLVVQQDQFDEKKIRKLVSDKKKEMDKKLRMRDSIDNIAAVQLVAKDLGLDLDNQKSKQTEEKSDLDKYIEIRNNTREQNLFLCKKLYDKIQQLKKEIEVICSSSNKSDILEGIDETLEQLKSITDTIFPINDDEWTIPTKLKEVEELDKKLNEEIPNALRQMFQTLYKGFLKNPSSGQRRLFPRMSIKQLLIGFDSENLDLRYPNGDVNPYLDPAYLELMRINPSNYKWHLNGKDELYHYYSISIEIDTVMRNSEEHKNDSMSSTQFELAQRKESDPISEISHPGNYITTANLVLWSIYEVVETLQIWIDTCVRIKLNSDSNFKKEQFLKDNLQN